MRTRIKCPKCSRSLTVPVEAAGKRAGCPACHARFIVPNRNQMLDDLASTWIEQDLNELMENDKAPPSGSQDPAASATVMGILHDHDPVSLEAPQQKKQRSQPPKHIPARRDTAATEPVAQSDSAHEALPPTTSPALESVPESPSISEPDATASLASDMEPVAFPDELTSAVDHPRLTVLACDHAGVCFAFDSRWLEHPGFRASLPVRCVFTGSTDRHALVARPMMFADRIHKESDAIHQIAQEYDRRLLTQQSPRQMPAAMGMMKFMPKPFNYTVPYYLCQSKSDRLLACSTRQEENGRVICEVLVPNPEVALRWLLNVNGNCGPEYTLLERQAAMRGDAWSELSSACRERLAVWCHLQSKERFIGYFNDGDFGKSDEGLAGLVMTDRRLIFHRYRHGGEWLLTEVDELYLTEEGQFAQVCREVNGRRVPLVRLRIQEATRFRETLARMKIKVQHNAPGRAAGG